MKKAESYAVIRELDSLGARSTKNSLYKRRLSCNVRGRRLKSTQAGAWEGLLIAILTTQQRSTGASNFTREALRCPALRWSNVVRHPVAFAKNINGFNHNQRKRDYLIGAAHWLRKNWSELKKYQKRIRDVPIEDWEARYSIECEASEFLETIKGIGKKQSRNFWQHRGYSVWTIPLDSRIKSILSAAPFHLDMTREYEDIEREVIQICRHAKTHPCLLDATLFNLEGLFRSVLGLPAN